MKRLMILGLVYIIGGISGVIFYSVTSGAADRGRIAVLESELNSSKRQARQVHRRLDQ